MSTCKVNYVDVVAYTSTVVCVVVVTENTELGTLAHSCLCDVRHKVVRNTIRVLADSTALVCTDWVEVTQENDVPLVVGLLYVHENLLEHRLCLAVRVSAVALWTLLCDRNDSRVAINSRT